MCELEAGELLRVEVLHVLGRHCGPNLEDLGTYELEVGELLRVEILRIPGRHCGPKLEDIRRVRTRSWRAPAR